MELRQNLINVFKYYIPVLLGYLIAEFINAGVEAFKYPIIGQSLVSCLFISLFWVLIDSKNNDNKKDNILALILKFGVGIVIIWISRTIIV